MSHSEVSQVTHFLLQVNNLSKKHDCTYKHVIAVFIMYMFSSIFLPDKGGERQVTSRKGRTYRKG